MEKNDHYFGHLINIDFHVNITVVFIILKVGKNPVGLQLGIKFEFIE